LSQACGGRREQVPVLAGLLPLRCRTFRPRQSHRHIHTSYCQANTPCKWLFSAYATPPVGSPATMSRTYVFKRRMDDCWQCPACAPIPSIRLACWKHRSREDRALDDYTLLVGSGFANARALTSCGAAQAHQHRYMTRSADGMLGTVRLWSWPIHSASGGASGGACRLEPVLRGHP